MSRKLSFTFPPARTSGEKVCYAPLAEMGLGTGRGGVIDQESGKLVRFPLRTIKLIHNVACVDCESVGFMDGLHLGVLPGGQRVWVRDVRDTYGEAPGSDINLKLYDSGDSAA